MLRERSLDGGGGQLPAQPLLDELANLASAETRWILCKDDLDRAQYLTSRGSCGDAGEISAFDLDDLIHHCKRSAQKLWSFRTGSAQHVARMLDWNARAGRGNRLVEGR